MRQEMRYVRERGLLGAQKAVQRNVRVLGMWHYHQGRRLLSGRHNLHSKGSASADARVGLAKPPQSPLEEGSMASRLPQRQTGAVDEFRRKERRCQARANTRVWGIATYEKAGLEAEEL